MKRQWMAFARMVTRREKHQRLALWYATGFAVRRRHWLRIATSTEPDKDIEGHSRRGLCGVRTRPSGNQDGNHTQARPRREAERGEVGLGGRQAKGTHKWGRFGYLGGAINNIGDVTTHFTAALARRGSASSRAAADQYTYDNPYIALAGKLRCLQAQVIETMPYGFVIRSFSPTIFDPLRKAHRGFLLGCLDEQVFIRCTAAYLMKPYCEILKRIGCNRINAIPYSGESYLPVASRAYTTSAFSTSSSVKKWSDERSRVDSRSARIIASLRSAPPSE